MLLGLFSLRFLVFFFFCFVFFQSSSYLLLRLEASVGRVITLIGKKEGVALLFNGFGLYMLSVMVCFLFLLVSSV